MGKKNGKVKVHSTEKLSPIQESKIKKRAQQVFIQLCLDRQLVPVKKYNDALTANRTKFTHGILWGFAGMAFINLVYWFAYAKV